MPPFVVILPSTELLKPSGPSDALTTPLAPDGTAAGENAEKGIGLPPVIRAPRTAAGSSVVPDLRPTQRVLPEVPIGTQHRSASSGLKPQF